MYSCSYSLLVLCCCWPSHIQAASGASEVVEQVRGAIRFIGTRSKTRRTVDMTPTDRTSSRHDRRSTCTTTHVLGRVTGGYGVHWGGRLLPIWS